MHCSISLKLVRREIKEEISSRPRGAEALAVAALRYGDARLRGKQVRREPITLTMHPQAPLSANDDLRILVRSLHGHSNVLLLTLHGPLYGHFQRRAALYLDRSEMA